MSRYARHDLSSPHVALVTVNPVRRGGMQRFTHNLLGYLTSARWRVTVALSGEDIYQDLSAGDPYRRRIDTVDWIDDTLKGDREYRRSTIMDRRRWFRRVRPDAVVFVQSSNTPYRASVVGAWLAGVPIVTTHRTLPWPVESVPSIRHLFGLVPGIGLHGRRIVRKTWLTAALARRVVYNSHAVRAAYERDYRYPSHKGYVIANAVTPGAVATPVGGDETITIGYVGRLGGEKRVDLLIRAMPEVRSHRRARLLIYGDGPERESLMKLAHELNVGDRVTFCGETDDPGSAYGKIDILAVCSDRESSSNAVLEAMAAGRAVVVTRVGGLPELIDDGACGLCVPTGDARALANALTTLANDDGRRLRLGAAARETAVRRHDPATIGRGWLSLLQNVVSLRTRRRSADTPDGKLSAAAIEPRGDEVGDLLVEESPA